MNKAESNAPACGCPVKAEENSKGKIIILSGPSGVGKNTVRKKLDYDALNLVNSVSWTTRAPRAEDIEGVTYHFVTPQKFEEAVEAGEFAEHAGFADHAYGTPKEQIESNQKAGKNVMLEIEVQGAEQLMEKYPEATTIFLVPPAIEDLRMRLTGRGSEDEASIAARLKRAETEMNLACKYKYVVVNDDAQRAADEIAQIIRESAD
ncbi:guanylate kinase [Allobaculum mucilyticum]|uniref:guanylate kinase n=1 Tax=Allobaculum mucilyticum TaxID=2834459 RepID=UPI001E5B4F16|nr:guanylate kinase [Allobaculum mucilyticum]UNT96358.1 guanylate kinase [Allobaculum mucilyticum]